jgi:hypothetical protein
VKWTKEYKAAYMRAYNKAHPVCPKKAKSRKLKSIFGIDLEDYNQRGAAQKWCCAICDKHVTEIKKSLCVDHDHTTGKVRDLLCSNCNTALGFIAEDSRILQRMIQYLNIHK